MVETPLSDDNIPVCWRDNSFRSQRQGRTGPAAFHHFTPEHPKDTILFKPGAGGYYGIRENSQ